jgi:hypothetical protein
MMDTFCVLPWIGREINRDQSETHCCLLPLGYDIELVKSEMLAGKKPTACQKCWSLEANNLKSDRQVKNSSLDFYWDRDLKSIKQDAIDGKLDRILILKLYTSNVCNATCVSCGPMASSSWSQLMHRTYPIVPLEKYKLVNLEKVKDKVDLKELKMLNFVGGEPLYEKKNFEFLEYLYDIGNTSLFVSMVTNGSVTLTDKQQQILSKFKNINFSVSIDGTESVFEYLRYPLKWSNLNRNLEFFREISNNISSNYTLSNLNILYHPTTIDWFIKNKINYSVSPVYNPIWLRPKALPESIKTLLKSHLAAADYNTFIGPTHTEQDQQNFYLMLEQTRLQDRAKKINMSDYLPELYQLFPS